MTIAPAAAGYAPGHGGRGVGQVPVGARSRAWASRCAVAVAFLLLAGAGGSRGRAVAAPLPSPPPGPPWAQSGTEGGVWEGARRDGPGVVGRPCEGTGKGWRRRWAVGRDAAFVYRRGARPGSAGFAVGAAGSDRRDVRGAARLCGGGRRRESWWVLVRGGEVCELGRG